MLIRSDILTNSEHAASKHAQSIPIATEFIPTATKFNIRPQFVVTFERFPINPHPLRHY